MMKSDIELNVVDLARGGAGVAKDSSGRVVFIPYTVPGDVVRAQIVEEDKKYAQGELVEIIQPSSLRTKPPCPAFGKCGGCQWQHLPYSLQWETKVKGVLHALKRVNVPEPESIDQRPADPIWEYRNRIQLRGVGKEIGFYRRGSLELVPVERCEIARPEINAVWEETRAEGEKRKKPYKVEIEVLPDGSIRKQWNSRHAAGGFRQVHDQQNERLRTWISQEISQADLLLDLFGGSGNLSVPLIPLMKEIHCVDVSAPRMAPEGIPVHFHFHKMPVLPWLLKFAQEAQKQMTWKTAVAIMDPPREGLAGEFQEISQSIDKVGVNEIIAVGCDVDAWARDMSRWVKKGWKIHKAMVLDFFPQTPHVESIAILRRD